MHAMCICCLLHVVHINVPLCIMAYKYMYIIYTYIVNFFLSLHSLCISIIVIILFIYNNNSTIIIVIVIISNSSIILHYELSLLLTIRKH